ncbi:MAG: response regulator transcription factor [Lachnospiraceae bacterium]|nr:response regulator transcription factor [Lachnospiraceae bacterium]
MERILIIEDEEAIAQLERDYLTLSGYEVVAESDGVAGRQQALTGEFDMILLDLMLPGEDGFSIMEAIRQKCEVPVMLISAKKDDIDKIRGLGLGADDYLTKPFSPSELVARVKAHIDRYKKLTTISSKDDTGNDDSEIRIREMLIKKPLHEVYVAGKKVTLTVREYELLLMLADKPGATITKEEIFESLWDKNSIGDIKTVAVHISRLRDKIEKDPASPEYIETVWGSGYRIKV